jgi:predicted nuclease with TOPRIM domain
MARAKEQSNGKLDEALTALLQAQAVMVRTQAAFVAQSAEIAERLAELEKEKIELDKKWTESQLRIDERFARIEAILIEHNRILQSLANTVGAEETRNPKSEIRNKIEVSTTNKQISSGPLFQRFGF